MTEESDPKLVRRAQYMDVRMWMVVVTLLGFLVLGPIWSEFGPGGPRNRWIDAGTLLVGICASIAVWRFLTRSFPAEEVEDLIPRLRELDEVDERWNRRRRR